MPAEVRDCRYARSNDRLYHASIIRLPDGGLSMPMEIAWNGQRTFDRARLNYLAITRDEARARSTCPTPESAIDKYLEQAIGIKPLPNRQYHLLGSSSVTHDGFECVELRFDAMFCDGELICRHAKDRGYWPVYVRLTSAGGDVVYEMSDVEFAAVESEGNHLYFPIRLTQQVYPGATPPKKATFQFEVDRSTLKVNQPIPASRFVLKPWPSERVGDLDTRQIAPARDLAWTPDERVGFPFAEFVVAVSALEKQKQVELAAVGNAGASADEAGFLHNDWGWAHVIITVGILAMCAGLYIYYRGRRLKA
jgi:hypothetical protein